MLGTPRAARIASTIRCTMSTTELPPGGWMNAIGVEAVDVDRLVAESIGHLLALHDEELVVGAVQRVEAVTLVR